MSLGGGLRYVLYCDGWLKGVCEREGQSGGWGLAQGMTQGMVVVTFLPAWIDPDSGPKYCACPR